MIKIKHIGMGKGQFFLIVVFVKAVLNFKQLSENVRLSQRERSRRTWERMMTVGIDPNLRTICLATWVYHGQVSFSQAGPTGWKGI
jgi:hypothetical protein